MVAMDDGGGNIAVLPLDMCTQYTPGQERLVRRERVCMQRFHPILVLTLTLRYVGCPRECPRELRWDTARGL